MQSFMLKTVQFTVILSSNAAVRWESCRNSNSKSKENEENLTDEDGSVRTEALDRLATDCCHSTKPEVAGGRS